MNNNDKNSFNNPLPNTTQSNNDLNSESQQSQSNEHISSNNHVSFQLSELVNQCEECLNELNVNKKSDSTFEMNLKHSDNCKKIRSESQSNYSETNTLCRRDLELLKDEMFNSIANSQMQSLLSSTDNSKNTSNRTFDTSLLNLVANTNNTNDNTSNNNNTNNKDNNNNNSSNSNTKLITPSILKSEGLSLSNLMSSSSDKDVSRPTSNFSSIYNFEINKFNVDTSKRFESYLNKNASFLNLRMFAEDNEIWKHIVKRIEPFLDVYSILMLRQTCKSLYYYKYRLRSHSTLSFRGFAGFDSKWIFDTILPLIHHVLDLPENCKIRFDFTGCILLKDISTVYLLRSNMINASLEMKQYARNVKELIFDFCHQITDKGLEVMLTTKLPNLQRLSLMCCRNENFTGLPFVRDLTSHNWPKFTKFRCTFSNIFLEPLQTIADFICLNCSRSETEATIHMTSISSLGSNVSKASTVDLISLISDNMAKENKSDGEDIEFEICGSWGSRRLLDKLGFGIYCSTFTNALKSNNYNMCSKLTKKLQVQMLSLSEQPNMKKNNCVSLLKNRGSELLVNCPITVRDRTHNNVGIWTLPILLVIQHQNMDMFLLLIKRGARLNVWDSMNKSPLLIACELSLNNFVDKILKFNLPPIPYDNSSLIPLIVAISNSNVELVKLLLAENFEINYKCPSIKNYKSPLYVACEHYNSDIIKLLLKCGADPNWKYRHRSTPTLLGYQQDPKILETFLEYGAGETSEKRWVLVQVMACAIFKDDYDTVKLLVSSFPDLIEREHEIWSKPLVAVSKLNRVDILEMLLNKNANVNTFDSFGTTPLHAACEEANMESIKLLLQYSANIDVQDVFGRTPLHLAIMENRYQVVTLLLEKGANIDLKEYSYGETALMTAIRTRNEFITTLILKTGRVDTSVLDYNGKNVNYYLQFYKMNKLEFYLTNQTQTST